MNKFCLAGLLAFIALPSFAASPEKAQAYIDRQIELTDFDEVALVSAEEALNALAAAGMSIQEGKEPEATEILTNTFAGVLPKAVESTVPMIEEIYTDEELDAILEFSNTEIGASFISKSAIVGGRSAAGMQEMMQPAMMDAMNQLMPLFQQ